MRRFFIRRLIIRIKRWFVRPAPRWKMPPRRSWKAWYRAEQRRQRARFKFGFDQPLRRTDTEWIRWWYR